MRIVSTNRWEFDMADGAVITVTEHSAAEWLDGLIKEVESLRTVVDHWQKRFTKKEDEVERLRAELGTVSEKLMIAGTENAGLRAELAAANREAEILLNAMIQLGGHVGLEQLPDVAGKITQISNLVAGLRAELAAAKRDALEAKQDVRDLLGLRAELTATQEALVQEMERSMKAETELAACRDGADKLGDAYNELIMAVSRKYEGETRHQTALRYIIKAEEPTTMHSVACDAARKESK